MPTGLRTPFDTALRPSSILHPFNPICARRCASRFRCSRAGAICAEAIYCAKGEPALITITRHQARLLRSVFRRGTLGIRHKKTTPLLVLHAEGPHLRARFQHGGLAVEFSESRADGPLDSIPVPLDVLAEIEGRDDTP